MTPERLQENTHCGHPASAFHHGAEGTSHCPLCEREGRLKWIEANLGTQAKWTLGDYREFYSRDVTFLLAEVKRLRAEVEEWREEARGSRNSSTSGSSAVEVEGPW